MARGQDFRPETRGDLRKALATRSGLAKVAPQSPRPAHMLASMLAGTGVTHDDLKVFEILVSLAYEEDGTMPAGYTGVEMAEVIRFLGNRCRREDVKAAFRRLKRTEIAWRVPGSDRYYEGVPLLQGWHKVEGDSDLIEYELPAPLRAAMTEQASYAYLELNALPPMRSKYSLAVYRRLAAMTASMKWTPGGSNRIRASFTVEQLADAIGFPKMANRRVHGGKLKKQVLDRLESDLSAVRNFSVTMTVDQDKAARGRPVKGVDFVLELAVPDHRHERGVAFHPKTLPGEVRVRIGGADSDRFRVGPALWRKAFRTYRHCFQLAGPRDLFYLWLVALDEALEGKAYTREAYKRQHRGQRLLDFIDSRGPEQAAWAFISEEADANDLAPDAGSAVEGYAQLVDEADERRRLRVDWDELKARKARAARKAAEKDSAPAPAKDSRTPPPPIRRPPPAPPVFLKKAVQTPTPAPATAHVEEDAPRWVKEALDPSRITRADENTWIVKPAKPPARPEGMPVLVGGKVDEYKAAMEAWFASRRQPEPAYDPLDD